VTSGVNRFSQHVLGLSDFPGIPLLLAAILAIEASALTCLWSSAAGFPSTFLIIAHICFVVMDILDNFLNLLKALAGYGKRSHEIANQCYGVRKKSRQLASYSQSADRWRAGVNRLKSNLLEIGSAGMIFYSHNLSDTHSTGYFLCLVLKETHLVHVTQHSTLSSVYIH
jgi:hypothetical protein